MKRRFSLARMLLLMGVVMVAAACGGSDPTPTSTPAPTATPEPGVTPTPRDEAFEARWSELIANAQAEGELAVISDAGRELPVYEQFTREFGIKALFGSSSSGRETSNRALAERGRGRYTLDINDVGAGSTERLVEAGALQPAMPLLFHPDALDLSKWRFNQIFHTDRAQQFMLAIDLRLSLLAEVFYNTDNVTQAEVDSITSYADLLRPEFAGRIVVSDPAANGNTGVRTRSYLYLGPEFIETLVRQNADNIVGEGDRQMMDGLARGKWDFAIYGAASDFVELETIGLPVKQLTEVPLEGGTIAEIRSGVGVFDRPAHPNAAQLYFNWLFTQRGQTAMQTFRDIRPGRVPDVSLRLDVPQGSIPDQYWQEIQDAGEVINPQQQNELYFQAVDDSRDLVRRIYAELGIFL